MIEKLERRAKAIGPFPASYMETNPEVYHWFIGIVARVGGIATAETHALEDEVWNFVWYTARFCAVMDFDLVSVMTYEAVHLPSENPDWFKRASVHVAILADSLKDYAWSRDRRPAAKPQIQAELSILVHEVISHLKSRIDVDGVIKTLSEIES